MSEPVRHIIKLDMEKFNAVRSIIRAADRMMTAVEFSDDTLTDPHIVAAAQSYRAVREEWRQQDPEV